MSNEKNVYSGDFDRSYRDGGKRDVRMRTGHKSSIFLSVCLSLCLSALNIMNMQIIASITGNEGKCGKICSIPSIFQSGSVVTPTQVLPKSEHQKKIRRRRGRKQFKYW